LIWKCKIFSTLMLATFPMYFLVFFNIISNTFNPLTSWCPLFFGKESFRLNLVFLVLWTHFLDISTIVCCHFVVLSQRSHLLSSLILSTFVFIID
jgi:hypothetical protein